MKLSQLLEGKFSFDQPTVERIWHEVNECSFGLSLSYLDTKFKVVDDIPRNSAYVTDDDFDHVLGSAFEKDGIVTLTFSKQIDSARQLINTVCHEMVHQAIMEKYGMAKAREIAHGEEFMAFASAIKKYHNCILGDSIE